ncbi:ArsJ-associated glyceraldehyde-3-phosphate dehydrogenase [Pseudoalteromonas sp. MTN2-4]|uniref:ArsJ-associated glyceraldehyde-3-phosphate dehydrogenase n=1 Tax=Pseudoalteromonas sp. MTN2-4 TaxID=3056555 RepID=UPI0036F36B10
MSIKVGINGFGRMGRLTMRALYDTTGIEIIQINDPAGNAETLAHLMNFDSVHGRWSHEVDFADDTMVINGHTISVTQNNMIEASDWSNCDLVIEASGVMKTKAKLQAYFDQGVKQVVVTAPVKEDGVLNVVYGVNHDLFDVEKHNIVTAASCTTNCLAPPIKVLQEKIGIVHGSMTTIHDITNTQTILDAPHKDLRRARACGMSLIPTTTGSATAITHIFPELKGKLNGHAVRVPLANASITDCVFEVSRATTAEEINEWMKEAAEGELKDILGFETRPLVSIDYKTDPRSSVVDAQSTMVVNGTQVKMYLWYDNEWGYANRTADLVRYVIEQKWG